MQLRDGRDAFLEQGVGLLAAAERSAAYDRFGFGAHQQAGQPRRVCGDPLPVQFLPDLLLGEGSVARQHFFEQPVAPVVQLFRKLQLPAFCQRFVGRPDAPGGEFQHPADVFRGDQMPGRPHHMRTQDFSPREGFPDRSCRRRFQPYADGPAGHGVILSLNGSHP